MFTEPAIAFSNDMVPAHWSPAFVTVQGFPFVSQNGSGIVIEDGPYRTSSGEIPRSSAASSTNGLNALPAWRRPWVARLNSLRPKLRPPTIARIAPVRRIDRDERRFGVVGGGQRRVDRALGGSLPVHVERRANAQASPVQSVQPVARLEISSDVLHEVGGGRSHRRLLGQPERAVLEPPRGLGTDRPDLHHPIEHEVPIAMRHRPGARRDRGPTAPRSDPRALPTAGRTDPRRRGRSRSGPLPGRRRRRARSRPCSGTPRGSPPWTTCARASPRGSPRGPSGRSSARARSARSSRTAG